MKARIEDHDVAGLKRYSFFCTYDGGGPAEEEEDESGSYVLYDDAKAALESHADALERIKLLENALLEIRDSTFRNSVQLRFIAANTLEKLK